MGLYGLPPIGQEQGRTMDGAQFHSPESAKLVND